MEKTFNQWALEGSKVTPNSKKMKISARSCAQTLSLVEIFFSYTVSLHPNLEYITSLRSVSDQLKGVRDDLKSSISEIPNLSIFIKIKDLWKRQNKPKSYPLWLYIYNNDNILKNKVPITKKSRLLCKTGTENKEPEFFRWIFLHEGVKLSPTHGKIKFLEGSEDSKNEVKNQKNRKNSNLGHPLKIKF